jgi:hypothetical protein
MIQGQSAVTADKERRIAAAYSVSMTIANRQFGGRGYSFWCFDANCGSGWNQEVDVAGSPLVFWQAARECLTAMTPCPFFCDRDMAAMASLQQRLAQDAATRQHSILIPGDNDEAIEVFAETVSRRENPNFALGAVLIDPNGWYYKNADGIGAPVHALTWFTQAFPRIDLILNLNVRTFRLMRPHHFGAHLLPPRDLLASLNKRHWLVGRAKAGQSRFILAVGRNIPTRDHASLGLYSWDGPVGREILAQAESDGQGRLEIAPALSGIPAASRLPRRADRCHAAGE